MRIRLTKTYETVEDADVQAELIADLIGDYVFTDEAFVRSLSTQNRTLFEKIFDEIKYLCKIVTSGSKEARELEKVKKVFSDVYRESSTTNNTTENNGGVRYSLSQQNVYDYSKPFAQQIDDYKSGKIPNRDTLLVGGTPDVYQSIGLNALPMTINTTHIDYALNGTKDADHHLGETILKQLPESIKEPIAVFVSQTKGNSSVVALLNFEVNGKQTVAPIVIDGFGVQNSLVIDSNAITSIYGKGSAINQLYQAAQDEANGKFSLLYVNKKEADSLLHRAGHQLSGSLIPRDGFYHSIRENDSPVKSRFNDVTETQQFKRWFGDWQKHPNTASKVVDKNGKPLVMYHGSNIEFTTFDLQKSGGNYGDTSAGLMFFTNKKDGYPDSASDYAREATKKNGGNEKVYEVYIQIFKPLELDSKGYYTTTAYFDANCESIYIKYLSGDYDGIIIKNSDTASDDGILCAVDSPTQIKSATDNIGTFDGNNGNINYSLSNDGEQATKKYGDYAVSGEDIRLEAQDDIAPLPENTESDAEYPDDYAPIGEGVVEDDAEIDGIIKTLKDGLSQKRQNYDTERKNLRTQGTVPCVEI